jgi:hypothetical protein
LQNGGVRSDDIMKLLDYAGLFGMWPPTAHDGDGKPTNLEHCLDTLLGASYRPVSGTNPIRIFTAFGGVLYIREIVGKEELFARVFCEFLNKHQDKAIREIGEIDVTFLG